MFKYPNVRKNFQMTKIQMLKVLKIRKFGNSILFRIFEIRTFEYYSILDLLVFDSRGLED